MAKKATKKKASKKPRPGRRVPKDEFCQMNARIKVSTMDWLKDTAEEIGISRDAFLRLILEGCSKQLQAAENIYEQGLFNEIESAFERKLDQFLEQATKNAQRLQSIKEGKMQK